MAIPSNPLAALSRSKLLPKGLIILDIIKIIILSNHSLGLPKSKYKFSLVTIFNLLGGGGKGCVQLQSWKVVFLFF